MMKSIRDEFYFPITMPLDERGHGPASIRDAVRLTWEVWDQELVSHASFDYLYQAIDRANELNEARRT